MEKDQLKTALRKHTMDMFQKSFYDNLTDKIFSELVKEKNNYGYVYFIRIKGTSKCKIGFANNLINRLNAFKTTLGDNIQLDGFIYSDMYKEIENELHKKNIESHIHREWFSLSLKQVSEIIDSYNGTLTFCETDNNLIIEDGIVVNSKNMPIAIIDKSIVFDTIRKYIIENNLKFVELSVMDIKKHLMNDFKITPSEIRKQIETTLVPSKLKRYHSVFENTSLVGRTYIFNIEIL
jgi:hypothetical protein